MDQALDSQPRMVSTGGAETGDLVVSGHLVDPWRIILYLHRELVALDDCWVLDLVKMKADHGSND